MISVAAGTLVGAFLFSLIGAISDHVLIGATIGAVVGGVVSLGTCSGWISVPTTGGIVGAVLFALLGPACDDYSGLASVPGFFLGLGVTWVVRGAVGWLGLRAAFLLPAIVTGMLALATAEPVWLLVAAIIGLLTLNWDPQHQTTPLSWRKRRDRRAESPSGGTGPGDTVN
ncbi:MAG: hypothetical protein ABIK89_15775 [Planctomycetota bacterium]